MLRPLLNVARGLDAADVLPDVPESLVQAVPDGLSLDHIRTLVTEKQDGSDAIAILSAVYAVLKSDRFESRLGDDVDPKPALHEIALQIGQMIEPICSGATYDEEDSTDYTSLSRAGLLGLHILRLLHTLGPRGGQTLPTRTLLSITAFTNRGDPWASGPCAELARSLLADYFRDVSPPQAVKPAPFLPQRLVRDAGADRKPSEEAAPGTERAHFITQEILTGFLRPLFAKSRPAAVTASGRAAAFPEPGPRYSQGDGFGGGEDVAATKPWKYAHRHAVTIFEWAVENAETDLLQKYWSLYTPVLLTLLDEPQPTTLKLRSLSIFRNFWRRCPEGLLSRTGLADVFEQAVFPTVLSLPSLTPEAESLALLGAAYPALFDMAGVEDIDTAATIDGHGDVTDKSTDDDIQSTERNLQTTGFSKAQRNLLDKIFREGIMVGYHHAKGHVRLVDFFCRTLRHLVGGIGILSVKYLKDVIPMISEILVDPFGTKYPPTLLSAMLLLQLVLQTCWPRIPHYCNEIIKFAMLSWLNVEGDNSFPPNKPTKEELKQQMIRTVEMLSAIMVAAKLDIFNRVRPLVTKDPRLHPLFISCEGP